LAASLANASSNAAANAAAKSIDKAISAATVARHSGNSEYVDRLGRTNRLAGPLPLAPFCSIRCMGNKERLCCYQPSFLSQEIMPFSFAVGPLSAVAKGGRLPYYHHSWTVRMHYSRRLPSSYWSSHDEPNIVDANFCATSQAVNQPCDRLQLPSRKDFDCVLPLSYRL
jgi:hypothetical protein